jgi:hypothetical protein
MTSVPLSVNKLEMIVETIARNLLEEWAINDRFSTDDLESAKQNAVNDTVFIVNEFMEHFNTYMMTEAEARNL